MKPKKASSSIRIQACRDQARKLLDRYHVTHPDAIDVETLAWLVGRLVVKIGGLDGAEGRLVATNDKGGVIRVVTTPHIGRFRFTVGHEIGHWVLHQRPVMDMTDTKENFIVWNDASEEAEANVFAAELLMPQFLFEQHCRGVRPTIKHLDALATEFRTSVTATAFQFWEYTNEPVALVISDGWRMRSFRPFKEGWPRIRFGDIHKDSAAGERLAGKSPDSGDLVRAPAYAWLEGFDYKPEADIMEDSRYLDQYDCTITLLWIDEPI